MHIQIRTVYQRGFAVVGGGFPVVSDRGAHECKMLGITVKAFDSLSQHLR